jgi:hypothetical protein
VAEQIKEGDEKRASEKRGAGRSCLAEMRAPETGNHIRRTHGQVPRSTRMCGSGRLIAACRSIAYFSG